MATSIAPVGLQLRSAYIYEFVESHELPSLNLSRSFGDVCCATGKWKHQCGSRNGVTPISHAQSTPVSSFSVFKPVLLIDFGLVIGMLLIIAVHGTPAAFGRPAAVVSTVIAFPSLVVAMSAVRYDVVVLLLKSYEFWYFFVVNSITCGLLGAYLNDLRAILSVLLWFGVVNSSLVDAKTLGIRKTVVASIVGAITAMSVLLLVQWGVVPTARHFGVLRYRDHKLCVEDVIMNGLGTITIMLTRNAIRRYQDLREQKRLRCTMLRCVSYRCTLKLRLQEAAAQSVVPDGSGVTPNYQKRKHVLNQMVYIDSGLVFDASDTFYPVELNGGPWPRWQRLLLAAVAFLGITLTIIGFAAVNRRSTSLEWWLFAGGLTFTKGFCIFLWGMSHTKVLRQTFFSFDFVFLSLQLTSAHLCACDMFAWDSRCLGLLSSWLWMHLVLTSDALTPVVRQKLSMQTWHLAFPVLLFVIGQVLFACEIVFAHHWDLQDRRIHTIVVGDRVIEYRIITFFFSRLATVFLWCLRLLWRILLARSEDLLMLRGKVAYAYL